MGMPWLKLWPQMVRSKAVMALSDAEFRAYIGLLLLASEAEPRGEVSDEDMKLLPDFIGLKCDKLRNALRNGDGNALRNASVTARNEWSVFQSTNADRQRRYRERRRKKIEDRGKKIDEELIDSLRSSITATPQVHEQRRG